MYDIKYVDHTYRDFSHYIEDGGTLIKHKKSGSNFPARLHEMLSEPNISDIITWMPHGRAFKILNRERLCSEAIPKYYACKKFDSFIRQLNGWGFKRLHRSGPDLGCYYHESFLRGKPKLTCLIRRLQSNLGKRTPFAEGEPNFYRINEEYPLPPPSNPLPQDTSKWLVASPDLSSAMMANVFSSTDASVPPHNNSSHQAGDCYYPLPDPSYSQHPPIYSTNHTTPSHIAAQDYSSNYSNCPTQGQLYHPAYYSNTSFPYYAQASNGTPNNDHTQGTYSQVVNYNHNVDATLGQSSSLRCFDYPESINFFASQLSGQENVDGDDSDPLEPIPIS